MAGTAPGEDHEVWQPHDQSQAVPARVSPRSRRVALSRQVSGPSTDYAKAVVTESRSLDRREDLDAQAEILLAIRRAGGDVVSITEPQFGKADFAGRVVTLVAQHANAEKRRTVKNTTYRGIMMVRDNRAHHGALPSFWATKGVRYSRQEFCENPAAVADIYERVAGGESLSSTGRAHGLYPQSVRNVIRFAANHTGVIECSYTHDGRTETWAHEVTPVVDSALWWRANKALNANKGGRAAGELDQWRTRLPGMRGEAVPERRADAGDELAHRQAARAKAA